MAKKEKIAKTANPMEIGFHVSSGLTKKYFHTFNKEGKIKEQGYVLSEEKDGYYLVQFFEWLMGEPSVQKLTPFKNMVGWHFYSDREEMIDVWEKECRKEGK